MKTTIYAMKQALHLLRWHHFGECRTYPFPLPTPAHVDRLLSAAIRCEEARTVEPCSTCGETEPFTGTCGTSDGDTRALCKRAGWSPDLPPHPTPKETSHD